MPLSGLIALFNRQYHQSLHEESLSVADGRIVGQFAGLSLGSVYQPIVSAATGRVVGHEALLRAVAADGTAVAPPEVFRLPEAGREIVRLDRLCRTLHTLNFLGQDAPESLYLNVNAGHLMAIEHGHGLVFEQTLRKCGLEPERIVLEVLESAVADSAHLRQALEAYRARGYRIALDDFGSAHSNFDRLWLLTPDIIKLDRTLLSEATVNRRARTILPRLVDILHELGATVVAEGIETQAQAHLAADAGVDLMQGYFFGRPHPVLQTQGGALVAVD